MQIGLVFGKEVNSHLFRDSPLYNLIRYMDSNFNGDQTDQKLVMGYCFFLNRAVILWSSKKQKTVSTSTTKAEYIALGHATREVVRIRRFINKMKIEVVEDLTLFGDNKISITLTKNAKSQHQIKHIDIQHYYIRELVNKREFTIK